MRLLAPVAANSRIATPNRGFQRARIIMQTMNKVFWIEGTKSLFCGHVNIV
jgi:hypothetical protein